MCIAESMLSPKGAENRKKKYLHWLVAGEIKHKESRQLKDFTGLKCCHWIRVSH